MRDPRIRDELRRHRHLVPYEYTKGPGRWQVSWFTEQTPQKEMAQVYVDDVTGRVTEAWTGFQVAWTMARGYAGAFGRQVSALYVWIPLCVVFVLPFLPFGRRRPGGGFFGFVRRPTLWHLDLLVLLSFSISLAFFDHAEIGLSVPLAYPCLLYLLVRMLLLAFGRGRPRAPLPLMLPMSWIAVLLVFLVGFRIGLNVTNSNVIDVGYAGVIGADKLLHGKQLYGNWPSRQRAGGHLRPGQLRRVRPVPRRVRVERDLGRPPRRACGSDRLRPADADRAVLPRANDPRPVARASCSPTGGRRIRSRCMHSAPTAMTRSSRC